MTDSKRLAGQAVARTYDICSLIAACASPADRARMLRASRVVFDNVVGVQYASSSLQRMMTLTHMPGDSVSISERCPTRQSDEQRLTRRTAWRRTERVSAH